MLREADVEWHTRENESDHAHTRDEKPSKKSTDAYVMKNNIEWVFLF